MSLLLAVIYLIFVSLGLPDSLLGSGWPKMQVEFGVPSSYAGYVFMMISAMTIISALLSPKLIQRLHVKWIVTVSIMLTVFGLLGFSFCTQYWILLVCAIPYGLGAGAIDAAMNHYVANNYSGAVMNFLHCFYGVGAMISPYLMALAIKVAHWNEGYRWTAFLQIGILLVVISSWSLWQQSDSKADESKIDSAGIKETIKQPGVMATLLAFFAYSAGEATCFLWVPSYFAGTRTGISSELVASFGSLIFGGLMLGRLIAGFIANRLGDRRMIRSGTMVELIGILLTALPIKGYLVAAIGFLIIGIGMGPIYPSIQHMAPINFGKRYSAAVIGLQMAFAYTGSTFMPTVFGILQQKLGIWIMPLYLLVFAGLSFALLELSYRQEARL
ncbi:MFS transporter [Lactobacillus sp. MRS-253-APC-2B]|uniref:MFS transporter n=1 Tax=Lactobacillus sp. MRS-253-APC-2B TaxID=2725305 RepID=UPI00146D2F06|nr:MULTISPECIES: MFS transporter [Lactobacillaceae]MCI6053340.1 MFS transporter [Limosilactobacillus mucosae]NME34337.1 MFS transporter [Lactobacillus sp. MRS-253-APC-2B]